jgi:hypothetical protein
VPTFSRVFSTPGGFYSYRFKHVIGPEISWTYRTRVEDFNFIPKFDGVDYFLGTNEVNYGIVQRFLAKRPGASGKPVPYEFLSWRVSQTYYVQIRTARATSTNYSSPPSAPASEHLSPLLSRFRLRPVPGFSIDQTLEYDVNFQQIRRSSVYLTMGGSRYNLSGGWSRSVRLSDQVEERTVVANSLRGAGGLQIVPGKLRFDGSADYDFVNKYFWHMNGRLRYDVQCCGFYDGRILQVDTTLNFRPNETFIFSGRHIMQQIHQLRAAIGRHQAGKVMVTGAGGFVAGHPSTSCAEHRGRAVRPRAPTGARRGRRITDVQAELNDPASIEPVLDAVAPDRIVHLAGQSSVHQS